ncbi:MAG: hypothetical protein ACLUW6_02385 [Coriobacteriaceae bacterium]
MEALLQNPEAFREIGFFWTFVLVIIAACVYFAPIIKQWLKTRIEGQKRTDQIIENCTAAINNNSEALRNNSEALRDNLADRDKMVAIIREHDRASDLRFQEQNASLSRIEHEIHR